VRLDKPAKFLCKERCDKECNEKGACAEENGKKVCKCTNGFRNYPLCEKGCDECKDDLGQTNTTECVKGTLSATCDCKDKQFTYPRKEDSDIGFVICESKYCTQ
jgi:hypothetical protein